MFFWIISIRRLFHNFCEMALHNLRITTYETMKDLVTKTWKKKLLIAHSGVRSMRSRSMSPLHSFLLQFLCLLCFCVFTFHVILLHFFIYFGNITRCSLISVKFVLCENLSMKVSTFNIKASVIFSSKNFWGLKIVCINQILH